MGKHDVVKYEDLEWVVEQQICVDFSKKIKDYSKKGLFKYILVNKLHNWRVDYSTTKYFHINARIDGKNLVFLRHPLDKAINLKFFFDIFGERQVRFTKDRGNYTFIPKELTFKATASKEGFIYLNKFKIHEKKMAFDRNMAHIQDLKNESPVTYQWKMKSLKNIKFSKLKNYSPVRYKKGMEHRVKSLMKKTKVRSATMDYKKKFRKQLLNGARVDRRIEKLVISQLFRLESNEFQDLNSHYIALTQGETGKSSVCGVVGKRLDTTSNSGVYGYYSTNKDAWNGGVVSQTTWCLIFDELNEVISTMNSRSDNIMNNINTPLEEGVFSYGKAGGREIKFGNQFGFMANISHDFHFENFIIGVITNNETAGRRFAYLIYDDAVDFENGGRRPKEATPYIRLVSECCTFFLKYILKKRNINKMFSSKRAMELQNKYQKIYKKQIERIELDNTKKFLNYFCEKSIKNRTKMMALKIAIFECLNDWARCPNIAKYQMNKIIERFIFEYEDMLKDIEISIENIIEHQNSGTIDDKSSEFIKNDFNMLTKTNKEICLKVFENLNGFDKDTGYLNYKNITEKGNLKYLRKDLLYNKTNTSNLNKQLLRFGIAVILKEKNILFRINNKFTFQKYIPVYQEELGQFEVPPKAKEKAEETKKEIEEAWKQKKEETQEVNDEFDIEAMRKKKLKEQTIDMSQSKKSDTEKALDELDDDLI